MMTWIVQRLPILCLVVAPSVAFSQGRFFDFNGAQIHYIEQGTGEPVVLVHGRGGNIQSWITAGVFPDLAKDYRVIAFDTRGHGLSAKPHDPKQYGREMSLDIVRLLDHLGIRKAHIVGFSMGGQLTSQLLTTHPDRFLTATLVGAAGRFPWTAEDDAMFEVEAAEIEKWGYSPSQELRALAPGAPKPTQADIERRSAARLANPNIDRFAIAALVRSFREQRPRCVSSTRLAADGKPGDYCR